MQSLEGKIAVVTGASSGIGEAIVKELVAAGMLVAGLARRVDKVEALESSLGSEKGALSAVKCDITKEEEVKSAFAWVEQNLGPPTVLINNAGLLKTGLVSDMDLEDMRMMFDTNVMGLTYCAKEALNSMVKNDIEGTIININSIGGHVVLPFAGLHGYNASKFAVTALTAGLRNEVSMLKANIRVISLSPGSIVSEMTDQFTSETIKDSLVDYDLLPASDIADCVAFILRTPQRMTITEMTVLPTKETILTRALAASRPLMECME